MSELKGTVHYKTEGDVAVLVIDNPPVNPLSSGVRQGLYDHINTALADDAVRAVLIYGGGGRAFIAGADISEFGGPSKGPNLLEVLNKMEMCDKPVIAGINGTAFGGGLEVALCCHYRIALPKAQVGLPEVKLGLLPGAGGTQRLPRLVGAEAALQFILTGNPIPAAQAVQLGIVDELIDGDDIEAAGLAYARQIIDAGSKVRRIRDLTDKVKADANRPEIFEQAEALIAKRMAGQFAPTMIIECVRAAVDNADNFDAGAEVEAANFRRCLEHPQREALIHVFFGDRAVAKIPGLSKDAAPKKVAKAAVIGCGTMGGGISMCFANAGIPVTVVEMSQENLERGMKVIEGNYASQVKRGRISQEQMDQRMGLINPSIDWDQIADVDMVIEAVYENLDLKKEIFERLDGIIRDGATLASNTSALDIDSIASATKRPGDVIGMHFFSPANVMRLLEVVRGGASSDVTINTAMTMGKVLGKVAVLAGNCPGFIGNRMIARYSRQSQELILEGATPSQIDRVIRDFGLPMGPFQMADLVGLDLGWRARKMAGGSNDPIHRIGDALCDDGRYGQKNLKGYYLYREGDRTPQRDEEVEQLIRKISAELGYEPREISDEEILERCIYALVNEGAKILEDGMALRSVDIDVVYINGYGFPAYRGGPMFYANQQGLDQVLAALEKYHAATGSDAFAPSERLRKLVAEGGRFE
ncbi:MAG: enoyl-CoA hydratase/isomerase family protein [Gammaproteobacteria bacterium AqS3]|nr:enoyl-CoA hydratase/isomerase family protein [Gammaproteobacteria bacterium AqS3]